MRRVAWAVLTGLGVFFIVLAVLSRFFVPAQAVKFPLNEYTKTTLQANNASYFSSKSVTELSGVTLQTTTTTKGDVAAAKSVGSSKVAVWQTYSAVEDITNHAAVSIPVDGNSLAFDRKTGVLVPWSGNTVAGKPVNISGQEQGSLFPLGTQKKDYQVFDTTLLRPVTFHYTGTATTDGVATYVFVANVPATQVGTKSLPGALVGLKPSEVTLPEFYSAKETYFVDPAIGVPLAVDQNVQQTLQDNAGTTRLVLLSADFKTTPASVASHVKTVKDATTKINVLKVIVPIVAGLLGVILQGGLIGRLVKAFGEMTLVRAGFFLGMVGLAALGFTYSVPLLLLVAAVSSSGTGVIRPALTSLITQKAARTEQGVVLGLTQSLNSIAAIVAPAIGGLLIDHSLLAGWALTAAGICGVALLF